MITTGIIRKLDDLGRIVIPRTIRQDIFGTYKTDGNRMEIFYGKDGTIILKPIKEERKTMFFNVEITMYTTEYGRGCRTFYKKIEAENEDQACNFAEQMLKGFLANDITVKAKVISEKSGKTKI